MRVLKNLHAQSNIAIKNHKVPSIKVKWVKDKN